LVRAWVILSSSAAPVSLIGGWSLAASRQPSGYDQARDTISALAARGATDRWIMTAALAVLGLCHIATASGLTEAGVAARLLLTVGGVATLAVAALPQPNPGHVPAATLGFVALALWPAVSAAPGRRACLSMTAVLLVVLGWLAVALHYGEWIGLSERVLAGAEALCPLTVAVVVGRQATVDS
jgi:hypothetical membrane protein